MKLEEGKLYRYRESQEAIQISVYLCTTYGIVILEIKSCNKRVISSKYSRIVSFFILANTQRKENLKMSIVYRGAPIHLHLQHLTPRQPLRFTHL